MTIKTLIFDVNETLLDLQRLKDSVDSVLGEKDSAEAWFSSLLHHSLVESIRGEYHDFSEIAAAVLKMQAKKLSKELTEQQISESLAVVKELDPYPEVFPALKVLKQSGINLVAFSNGKPEVLQAQLEYGNIKGFFNEIYSVDACKRYKPHPDSYEYLLKQLRLSPGEAMMVAAHGWDIAGAKSAGLKTAFVRRPGKSKYPLAPDPDFEINNLTDLIAILKEGS